MATSSQMKVAPSLPFVDMEIKTKLNKDDTSPVLTKLRIIFDDDKAAQKFAARAGAIAWQATARMTGAIPSTDEVLLSDLAKRQSGGGFKATPESLANRVAKMSNEDYVATLEKLGMDKATIAKMSKAHAAKNGK